MSQEIIKNSESSGQSSRGAVAVIGDVEKLIKVAQILETVGQAVIPAIIEGAINVEKPAATALSPPNDPVRSLPKGFHFLHSTQAQPNDEESSADSDWK